MERTAKHIVFRGNVQGVGFRYSTHRIARRYDVTGFVRNCPDGTVEMLLQGPAADVDACLRDVQDSFASHIRDAKVEAVPGAAGYDDFRITF
ncbi:MAG: acylphosphatase [Sedimentisphaerales bacterium]|nr:acylphosphatase [Sedimentisphaerales bacterium]